MYLSLADNGIGSGDADVAALEDFRDGMMSCPTLTHVDLLYNRIGERGARVSGEGGRRERGGGQGGGGGSLPPIVVW